ncbi:MAG: lysoplasmalogenase [Spirochaetae bacterium HGW-Spirochaetae-5]|nr:MAG: lysoplasmalogenase [Spirochaetae bacterium HGW-Spirochaetae-5]
MNFFIISAVLSLLAGLLYFEKKESVKGLLIVKPLLSSLFIITALIQNHQNMIYFYIILSGLLLCLIGDVCLIFFFNKKIFTSGLAAFLAGHIMYMIAFFKFGESGTAVYAAGILCLTISSFIFIKLKPHLGNMKKPVIAYIAIITVMVISAFSFHENSIVSQTIRNTIIAAALIFYASDIFVARHRFVKKEFLNRAIGLPMYYTAQFMLALSTGMF